MIVCSLEPEGEVLRQPGDFRAEFSVSGAIKDAIYSRSAKNWDEIFDDDFDDLMEKPREYWIGLMRTAFSGPRVRVAGIPSEEYR